MKMKRGMGGGMGDGVGRILAIIGLFIIIGSMLLTSVIPGGVPQDTQSNAGAQGTLAAIVFPPPNPNVTMGILYVHPKATFVIAQPQGYTPTAQSDMLINGVSMVDNTRYSVLHAYMLHYGFGQSVQVLDAENSPDILANSWSQYDTWMETGRDAGEDRLTISFTLDLAGNHYLARHITWADEQDDTWVYVVRLVVPENNPALLDTLEELIIPSFDRLPDSRSTPIEWTGAVNVNQGYSIRYPLTWRLTEGGPGQPSTLATGQGTLTLRGSARPVPDADAVPAWVQEIHPEAEILAVEPAERAFGAGYAVAFTYPDTDGARHSKLAVLINTPDGQLVSAMFELAGEASVNLLDEEARAAHGELWAALASFAPLPAGAVVRLP